VKLVAEQQTPMPPARSPQTRTKKAAFHTKRQRFKSNGNFTPRSKVAQQTVKIL
jgi:hypothetical protein